MTRANDALKPRVERLLVVRLSSLGDVILATPALRRLREAHRDAELVFVVDRRFAAVLRRNPHVDRLIETEARGRRLVHGLVAGLRGLGWAGRRFDLAVDLHGKRRSAGWVYASRARTKIGGGRRAWPMWAAVLPRDDSLHEVRHGLRVAAAAGADAADCDPEIFLDEAADRRVRERLASLGLESGGFLLFAPFTRWASKNWPLERFAALVERLGDLDLPIVVIGGPDDRESAARLVASGGGRVISLAGALALEESLCLCRHGRSMVSGDSGLMHAAAAVGTRVVALFGPTLPERSGPWGRGHEVVQSLRPPAHRAYRDADGAAYVRAIEIETVEAAIRRALRS